MKENTRKECYRRARAFIHNQLNAKNQPEIYQEYLQFTSNTLAIPVITCRHLQFQCYQLGLRRNKTNGQKDTKATYLQQDQPPKTEENKKCFKTTKNGLNTYLLSSDGKMLNLVLQHENEQTAKATKTAKEIKKKAK